MRYAFIARHKKAYPVKLMCKVLEVSRSGFYDWCQRPESLRARQNRQLDIHILSVFKEHKERYGAPRLTVELKERNIGCSANRVERRMKKMNLKAKAKRKYKVTTDSNHNYPVAPNRLEQDFTASKPNEKWVTDITYCWTRDGWLYLAVILDLYSRAVVGWGMSQRMTKNLVCEALTMALKRRHYPTGVIVHSDRGSQYASGRFQALLSAHGLLGSMSKRGDCYDNAAMESFFHTLKVELVHDEDFVKREHAIQAIFEYMECYYNAKRKHSAIGYYTPMQYDNLANRT